MSDERQTVFQNPEGLLKSDTPYIPSPDVEGDKWYTLICEDKKLGLKFNGVEITTIVEGSWAARNGIEVDDEIVEVDNAPFGPMSRQDKLACLQAARPLTIKFKRPIIKDAYYTLELHETKVGLGFKGARVSNVVPGGWADRAKIMLNDEIAEVNGTGFFSLSDDDKIRVFKQPRPVTIRLKRPAKTRKEQAAKGESILLPGEKAFAPEIVSFKEKPKHEALVAPPPPKVPDVVPREPQPAPAVGFCACCANTTDSSSDIVVRR